MIKAKKLWSFLRIAFFMIRKGLISKRKLVMDMNLMIKRGKVLRKTLGNLMSHHHSKLPPTGGFGIGHYEFSCTNTPINPLPFFHAAANKKRNRHHYFPCINPPPPTTDVVELEEEYDFEERHDRLPSSMAFVLPAASKMIKLYSPPLMVSSPLSVRVSNYYSSEGEEEEEDDDDYDEINEDEEEEQVDAAAEDFIKRFYEQLRVQNGTHLIQYQEIQYQEMLARGTC